MVWLRWLLFSLHVLVASYRQRDLTTVDCAYMWVKMSGSIAPHCNPLFCVWVAPHPPPLPSFSLYLGRSGSKTPGQSFGGIYCGRRALVLTRHQTDRRCSVGRHRALPQKYPTPPWAPLAPPQPWQTWLIPQCLRLPLYSPQCPAAWKSTSAGARRKPRWRASSDRQTPAHLHPHTPNGALFKERTFNLVVKEL